MFKTELHCHSMPMSLCARVDNDVIIEKYLNAGYSTIVLANHFNQGTINGHGFKSYKEFADAYIGAYKSLKEASRGKLEILLGMEMRFNRNINDYLVFGIDEDFIYNNPSAFDMSIDSYHKLVNSYGGLLIQAHPFRNDMTVVPPYLLDGVEVFNGHMGHDSRNDIANMWADKHSLIKTSGTDFHYADVPVNAGIMTSEKITDMKMLVEILKSGNYTLIKNL